MYLNGRQNSFFSTKYTSFVLELAPQYWLILSFIMCLFPQFANKKALRHLFVRFGFAEPPFLSALFPNKFSPSITLVVSFIYLSLSTHYTKHLPLNIN